jgi:hypothetical protein
VASAAALSLSPVLHQWLVQRERHQPSPHLCRCGVNPQYGWAVSGPPWAEEGPTSIARCECGAQHEQQQQQRGAGSAAAESGVSAASSALSWVSQSSRELVRAFIHTPSMVRCFRFSNDELAALHTAESGGTCMSSAAAS